MATSSERDGDPPPHERDRVPLGMGTGLNSNPLGALGGRGPDGGSVTAFTVAVTLALLIAAGVVVAFFFA